MKQIGVRDKTLRREFLLWGTEESFVSVSNLTKLIWSKSKCLGWGELHGIMLLNMMLLFLIKRKDLKLKGYF